MAAIMGAYQTGNLTRSANGFAAFYLMLFYISFRYFGKIGDWVTELKAERHRLKF